MALLWKKWQRQKLMWPKLSFLTGQLRHQPYTIYYCRSLLRHFRSGLSVSQSVNASSHQYVGQPVSHTINQSSKQAIKQASKQASSYINHSVKRVRKRTECLSQSILLCIHWPLEKTTNVAPHPHSLP